MDGRQVPHAGQRTEICRHLRGRVTESELSKRWLVVALDNLSASPPPRARVTCARATLRSTRALLCAVRSVSPDLSTRGNGAP